jgi:hypothetical protein
VVEKSATDKGTRDVADSADHGSQELPTCKARTASRYIIYGRAHPARESDRGHLHTGGHANQTCSTNQTGEDDFARKNCGGREQLKGLFLLLNLSEPFFRSFNFNKPFRLLASSTGFEPVLPP